ncbi:hypothetical protein DT070_16525 [Polaromonas sp. SP1]|nr:hypothetical protein DT070_16525 [Polaromonas sp. SP1]
MNPPSLPAAVLPNGGSRDLGEDVLQSAEEAVLARDPLTAAVDAAPFSAARTGRRTAGHPAGKSYLGAIRSQVAAHPGRCALIAAAAGALVAALLRRQWRGR